MLLLLISLIAANPFSPADDCIYEAVSAADRHAIGEAVLAKQRDKIADLILKATNSCAHDNHWSTQETLQRNGYATMRFAADVLASRLGRPELSGSALRAIRQRPLNQIKILAGTGTDTGNAEFKLVLERMIADDPTFFDTMKNLDTSQLNAFVLMVKLDAIAEISRLDS